MGAIRRILVPVDFSEPSGGALAYAAALARPLGAAVDVVHVVEVPAFVPSGSLPDAGADLSLVALARENADKLLATFIGEAAARGIMVQRCCVDVGSPAHVITELAKNAGYDLIVIGTHGRTGLAHALIGSVAERVVRHAPCPVLSVRPPGAPSAAA